MLKTNSKEVRNRIRQFVVNAFNYEQYETDTGIQIRPEFDEVKKVILDTFNAEKFYDDSYAVKMGYRPADVFESWVCGLPTYLECDDIVLNSANDTLGEILEQTETEKARFSEMESMKLFIYLIYRELTR